MRNNPDSDPIVARALADVRVPDHDPDFWTELEGRLAGAPEIASVVHIDEQRRRRPWPFLLAAAAVVAVVASVTMIDVDSSQQVDTTPADPTPTTVSPTPSTTVPASTTGENQGAASAEEAVDSFIRAVGEDRLEDAAALTGPRTKAYVTGLGGTIEGMLTESESYGAWIDTDYSKTEVDLGVVEGLESTVVVVSGEYSGEGPDGFRHEAYPVTRSGEDGTWLVEFMAFDGDTGGRLEILDPAAGESGLSGTTPDGVIRVAAEGAGDFWFSLEDQPAVKVAGKRNGGGSEATFDPPGDMATQTNLLVVAYVNEFTFTAFAGTFVVEG